MAKKKDIPVNANFEGLKNKLLQQKAEAEAISEVEPLKAIDVVVDADVSLLPAKEVYEAAPKVADEVVAKDKALFAAKEMDEPANVLKLNKKENMRTKRATYYLQKNIVEQIEHTAKALGISGSELANSLLEYALGALEID